jgi:hypothetical protein
MYNRSYTLHYDMHIQRAPKLYAFLTSALDGGERKTSCSYQLFPAEIPQYQTVWGGVSQTFCSPTPFVFEKPQQIVTSLLM